MPLTISVTLEDDAIEEFLSAYNEDAGTEITADMLLQNEDFKATLAEDLVNSWLEQLHNEDYASAYDLYNEFFSGESDVDDIDDSDDELISAATRTDIFVK